jgi:hypothetical protein
VIAEDLHGGLRVRVVGGFEFNIPDAVPKYKALDYDTKEVIIRNKEI